MNASYWLYLQNWLPLFAVVAPWTLIHFWSLAVEEQFYLIWPLLVRIAARRGNLHLLCIVTMILAVVLRAAFVLLNMRDVAFYFTLCRMDALAIGAYAAVLFARYGTLDLFRRRALVIFITGSLLMSLLMLQQGGLFNLNPLILLVGYFPLEVLLGSFLIISLASTNSGLVAAFLQNRHLRLIGKISYGVYVFHWPITLFFKDVWPDAIGNFWLSQATFLFVVTISSITLAFVSYHWFESPILKLKQKLAPLEQVAN